MKAKIFIALVVMTMVILSACGGGSADEIPCPIGCVEYDETQFKNPSIIESMMQTSDSFVTKVDGRDWGFVFCEGEWHMITAKDPIVSDVQTFDVEELAAATPVAADDGVVSTQIPWYIRGFLWIAGISVLILAIYLVVK